MAGGFLVFSLLASTWAPGVACDRQAAAETNIVLAEGSGVAKGDPVPIENLPSAVVEAVKKDLPGARLTKAAKLPDGNYFLTDVKVGKKEYTVTVTPDGKILKRDVDND